MFIEPDLKPSNKKLKSFAGGMAGLSILAIPFSIYFFRDSNNSEDWLQVTVLFATLAFLFIICRLIWPPILKLLYLMWVGSSSLLGLLIAPILLMVIYYFVISPIGLLSRATGKTWIHTETESSYWKRLKPFSKDSF